MPHVTATTKTIIWSVGDPPVAAGMTEPTGTTVTGLVLRSAESRAAFLTLMNGCGGTCNPLPETGEWVETDGISSGIYTYDGSMVIAIQSHARTIDDPADIPALFAVYHAEPLEEKL